MQRSHSTLKSGLAYVLFASACAAAALFGIDALLGIQSSHSSRELATDLLQVVPTTLTIYVLLRRESSARERAVASQRSSERRLANLLETTTSAIIGLDSKARIFLFNRGAENIFGHRAEEVRGKAIDLVIPKGLVPLDRFSQTCSYEVGASGNRVEVAGRRKDGTIFPAEAVISELKENDDLLYTIVLSDITERSAAEEMLRKSHEELEARVRKRTRELAILLDISRQVGSTFDLEHLFGLILDQLHIVIDYTGAAIFTLDDQARVTMVAYRGEAPTDEAPGLDTPLEQLPCFRRVVADREPLLLDDLHGEAPLARELAANCGRGMLRKIGRAHALVAVPLITQERVIGLLRLEHARPGHFSRRHVDLAATIGNQAAVALENARLYRESRKLAALEERERLGRQLHDSVSQALYAIGLGVNAASEMLERDPARLGSTLESVRALAEAALSEMRALIFQLHPDALEDEGLAAALPKLAEVVLARQGIDVRLHLDGEEGLSMDVKEGIYRICQEALWNTAKHASARTVIIRTSRLEDAIALEIIDDGIGFDPARSFRGHLGLKSMRERAACLSGDLRIDSAPDRGTRVCATIPLKARQSALPPKRGNSDLCIAVGAPNRKN